MERMNMSLESKPVFGSMDHRDADRKSDWTDYFWIAVGVVGLLLWKSGESTLAILSIVIALHWGSAKWGERRSAPMDCFWIAVSAVCGVVLWNRGSWRSCRSASRCTRGSRSGENGGLIGRD